MDPKSIFETLQAKFGDQAVYDLHADAGKDHDPWFFVKPEHLTAVCTHLRDDPAIACDYLECLSGVDYPDKNVLHVVYHLFSYTRRHRVVLKVVVPREAPTLPTVSSIWSAANWQERECYDLLGVVFEGHPNLRRILLPDDWVGHPLRKDYKEQPDYHGIPTTRPNPLELLAIKPAAAAKPASSAKPADSPAQPQTSAADASPAKPSPKPASASDAKSEAASSPSDSKAPAEAPSPAPSSTPDSAAATSPQPEAAADPQPAKP